MKNIEHDNFVGIYDGFFSPVYCDKLIAYHDWCTDNNRTFGRPNHETIKKDESTCLNPIFHNEIEYAKDNLVGYVEEFNRVFWDECYKDYSDTYSNLHNYDNHTIFTYKIQKTEPGGGYHIWHCENGEKLFSKRVGVYILYLNDVEEGGETELWASYNVKPEAGKLLLFPATWTYPHRGKMPISNDKYIITGWIYLQE